MSVTWKHREIGEFERDQFEWQCDVPSFWRGTFPHCDEKRIPFGIEVVTEGESEPAPQAIEQIEAFWAHKDGVPDAVCSYIWAEIEGGQSSNSWWCWMDQDEWEDLVEEKGVPRPDSKQDLFEHLIIPVVRVRHFPEVIGESLTMNPFTGEEIENRNPPPPSHASFWAVELAFRCLWEEEHGIAAFWRNREIIGTGYGDGQSLPPDDYTP